MVILYFLFTCKSKFHHSMEFTFTNFNVEFNLTNMSMANEGSLSRPLTYRFIYSFVLQKGIPAFLLIYFFKYYLLLNLILYNIAKITWHNDKYIGGSLNYKILIINFIYFCRDKITCFFVYFDYFFDKFNIFFNFFI